MPFLQSYSLVKIQYDRREEGFLELGAYFDGSNSEGLMLNETQPIIMRHDERRVRACQHALQHEHFEKGDK